MIDYEYTNKSITPWGGLRLIADFYERCGLRDAIRALPLPEPGSNRGYHPSELIDGFLTSVLLGARRFSHSGTLRHDEVIKEIFGWSKGMASQSTFSRFFRKFSLADNDAIFRQINRWWFDQQKIDKYTLDMDSTVITRYGEQVGVEKGYNSKKHGRGSHHPLMAFVAEVRMVVQAWMRTGDSASGTLMKDFFDEVLAVLDTNRIGLIRADSGFYGDENLRYFENKDLTYIISAKMNRGLVQTIYDQKGWLTTQDGIDYCVFYKTAIGWEKPRRFVVVRKDASKLEKSGGKTLFPEYDEFSKYRYSAFVTNSKLSGDLIWQLYKQRANAENQIKELKENYGIEGFCSESFEATESAFRWAMVAYNLMSLFKLMVVKSKSFPMLSTLKFQCIAIGGYIVRRSRKSVLKLAVQDKRRGFLDKLFLNLSGTEPPFHFSNA